MKPNRPAVCIALVAGLVASAAESHAVISTPAVQTFHVDDAGPHWSHILATDSYGPAAVGSNSRIWTSERPFDFG